MKIGIIGAGPAGLTAAYELVTKGLELEVFEATDHLGGLARSIEIWNQRLDLGPHRFFSSDLRVNKLWLEVVGNDYAMVDRLTRIYYRNRFYHYPLKPFDALSKIGIREASRITGSYALGKLKAVLTNGEGDSLESWLISRFGTRLYEIFFETYSRKLWGVPCDEMDIDFAAQRIKEFSLFEALRRTIIRNRNIEHRTLVEQFAYPLQGTGMVYERMAERIRERGGTVNLKHPVKRVLVRNHAVSGLELSNGETRSFDRIISTMPLTLLVAALPEPPEHVIQATKSLTFRNTIFVYLRVRCHGLFPDNWLYIHSAHLKTGRIANFRNWVPSLFGDEKDTILCLEFWCSDDDPIWSATDDALVAMAKDELGQTALIDEEEVVDGHVERAHRCYPVYRKGYRKHIALIRDYLVTVDRLEVIGRYGAFKYNNQDHSILMGILAAENLAEGADHDLWSVNTDYDTYCEKAIITETGLEKMTESAASH